MALPSNEISVVPQYAPFLEPDSEDTRLYDSLEEGGVAINDATQGRLVNAWRCWIEGGTSVRVGIEPDPEPGTELFVGVAIDAVSLAWDSNMAPTIAYRDEGVWKLRWYNSLTEAFQIDSYPTVTSARVSTDDKRETQEGASDVIFAYTIGEAPDGVLYWRQQRDRYLTEYTVGAAGRQLLRTVGMNAGNRLQFELVDPEDL
jgi:hypothetical protein